MSEAQQLFDRIQEHYGSSYAIKGKLFVRDERLFYYTGGETKLENVWSGLHIGNTDLSLTIEGSQLLGASATKNKIEVTRDELNKYFAGEDLETTVKSGPIILHVNSKLFAPATSDGKTIKNTLSKSRTLKN